MDLLVDIDAKYRRWMSLTGGIIIHLTLGCYYTFGNINPYLTSYLRDFSVHSNVRYSNSIWVQSWTAALQALAAIFCGLLTLRGISPRVITLIGCLIMSASIMLTYFTVEHSLTLVTLTYGVGNGFGNGLAYVPPMGYAMKWFANRKGEANAAVLCGFGAGALIFTLIQTYYINPNNYPPDLPYSSQFPNEKYFSKKHMDLLQRVPKSFLLVGGIIFVMQMIGLSLISEPPKDTPTKTRNSSTEKIVNPIDDQYTGDIIESEEDPIDAEEHDESKQINSLGVEYHQHAIDSGLEITKVLRLPAFYMLWLSFVTSLMVPTVISSYYKTFGETFIKSDKYLSLVGSISSVFNALGRPVWGIMLDKFPFKVCMLILNTLLISFCMTLYAAKIAASETMLMIWICGIYFTFCGIYVMMPTITTRCFGQKYFTMNFGVVYTCGVVSSLSTAFLGNLINSVGWYGLFAAISGFNLLSWITMFLFNVRKGNGEYI